MGFERDVGAKGQRMIWLETAVLARPSRPVESYSDAILRLVEMESTKQR